MAKTTKWGGPSDEYAQRRANPPTMADALRARGKLGPYEEAEVLNECPKCTTKYAADLDACPQCGEPREPVVSTAEWTPFADSDEVYPEQVSAYEGWLLADLQDECVKRGLVKSGNKPELVQRLLDADKTPTEEDPGI